MTGLDYWRLCDELNVQQAALLIIGEDPSGEQFCYVENWKVHERPQGYETAKIAIKNAIISGRLQATIRRSAWDRGWNEDPAEGEELASGYQKVGFFPDSLEATKRPTTHLQIMYRAEPDWELTTFNIDDLRNWLMTRGFSKGFFFPDAGENGRGYLNRSNPRYAPKLAAAVRAWESVVDPRGKSPKQALTKWLREHASEFSLSDDEGNPNQQGIDEVAKVANWQPSGGVPKTPS